MRRSLALAVLLPFAVVVTGCGHSSRRTATGQTLPTTTTREATTTRATTTVETQPAPTSQLRVYFLRDGKVAPVARAVQATPAVAGAALQALVEGPTERGLTTAVPAGAPAPPIVVDGGVATVDLPAGLSHRALAQIVYTLTQFPTIHAVRATRSLEAKSLTRADFEDVTPAILVETPLPGERVVSPLRVRGTANTFEATFVLEIRNSSNQTFTRETVTATSGSGARGTFDTTISFAATGPIWLVAYEASAENGRPLHTVRIPLVAG